MASILKHLRSSTADKRPTASGLADGQIALNTASGTPAMFFKDNAGNIVKVGPAHIGTTAPNVSPAGSAGNSDGELWIDESLTTRGLKYYDGTAFVNLTPSGTTSTVGLVELATDAETQAGTDNVRVVTPSGLQSKISNSTSTTSSTTIASSTAVKSAFDLANAALPKTGGTLTGELLISPSGSLVFEGSSDDSFETTIAVTNPTADRTITFPNVTGNVVTTGDSGTVTSTMILDDTIVNADINSAAAIAHSKLANITAGSVLLGNASNVPTATALSGDVTINSSGVTAISAGVIVNADINASAAIVDTKLDTIATADKVSLSALNIDGATDIGGALENGDLFIVDDGAGGTNRKAQAFRMAQLTYSGVTGDITVASGGTAAISAGVIVNADVNASAAIAGTKISPDFGSQTITTTGVVSAALGAAATPSLTFTGDLNTGIYSPGADQVAISTGGSGRLFVDASGNVGVGASSLSRNFTVRNASTIVAASLVSNPTNIAYLLFGDTDADAQGRVQYNNSTDSLELYSAGSERLRITSAGLVGVGTSSPQAQLQVLDRIKISDSTQAQGSLQLGDGASTSFNVGVARWNGSTNAPGAGGLGYFSQGTANSGGHYFYTGDAAAGSTTLRMTIAPGGSVGIGTSAPGYNLELAGSNPIFGIRTSLQSASSASTILFRNKDGNGNDYDIGKVVSATVGNGGYGELQFYTAFNNTLSQQAVLTREGRLGIGATPAALFDANGLGRFLSASPSYPASGKGLEIYYDSSGDLGYIQTYDRGASAWKSVNLGGASVRFNISGNEAARIDSSSRLLLGTSSGSDNNALLKVQGNVGGTTGTGWIDIRRGLSTPGSGSQLGLLSFSDSSGNQYAYIEGYVDAAAGANDYPGRLVFSTTADGASSPTERMRITNNGSVYIGATSAGGAGWTTNGNGSLITQYTNTSDTRSMYTWNSDNAGTNTTAVYIESTGKIYARTTTVQAISSERRLKENIVSLDATDAWETIKSVPFYSYNFIGADPSNVLYGPMADEVPDEMRVPTSQSDDVGVIHTYDNGMLQARLYVALQAALNKIETLEAKVAALESA